MHGVLEKCNCVIVYGKMVYGVCCMMYNEWCNDAWCNGVWCMVYKCMMYDVIM